MTALKNAVTLITGGANVIGSCVARQFLQKGSRIVLCDLPDTNGKELATELGENCIFAPVDVKNEEDVQKAVESTQRIFGQLNIVINCAEKIISSRTANWTNRTVIPQEVLNDVLLTNVSGTFNVIRHAVPLISKNERVGVEPRGIIINKSSSMAYDGYMGTCPTALSKGAVNSMTLPLAREFSEVGIRVVAIATGFFADETMTTVPSHHMEIFEQEVLSPKRLGYPMEYADLCESIIDNPMINGHIIRLDGGLRFKQADRG